MGEAVLSLNSREQQILARIGEELARTTPALISLLTFFNRLVSDEDMPPRRPLRRLRRRLSATALTWSFVALWSTMTAGMITTALVLNSVGHA
jgi:hypothetical protein